MTTIAWLAAGPALSLALGLPGLAVAALLHRPDMGAAEDLLVAMGAAAVVPALAAVALLPFHVAYVDVAPIVFAALLTSSGGGHT